MKIIQFILGIVLIVSLGCQQTSTNDYTDIDKEIDGLETVEAKKQFMEKIMEDDQKVRTPEGQQLKRKHGENSKEYLEYTERQSKQDKINLIKIEKYFKKYGHPKRSEVGEAVDAPWMVIHHADYYEDRERNFEYVYSAYLSGDIDDGAMSFYLGRMYQYKHNGQRLKMKSPYMPEDEINQLIKELNLEEKKANVQKMQNNVENQTNNNQI